MVHITEMPIKCPVAPLEFAFLADSYFKHTVYGLRMLCKVEGLKPHDIGLPSIKGPNKLPVVLSKEEMWRLLCTPDLLKHKILIGLLYGCGLRCKEARSV